MNKSVIELAKQSGFWQEQIIEMAKQAVCYDKHDKLFWGDVGQIQTFAQLVRNAALEEAAMKCDQIDLSFWRCGQYDSSTASDECAKHIRGMKA